MTAGMATSRPTAVATSASEMPHITAPAAARLVARQIGERLDDAEDGAEEADEGGVVAEGAEDAEVTFELDPQAGLGAGHRLGDGVGAAGSSAIPAAATAAAGARCPSRRRVAPAGSEASSRSSIWRPSTTLLPPVPPKQIARSTITATERIDSAMSTQRTQSEPSSVKPRIRWVRCMRSPRRPWKTLSQTERVDGAALGA